MTIKMVTAADSSELFLKICTDKDIKPTRRQWKKFQVKRGQAWNVLRNDSNLKQTLKTQLGIQ